MALDVSSPLTAFEHKVERISNYKLVSFLHHPSDAHMFFFIYGLNPDIEAASNFISHWTVFSSAAGRRNLTTLFPDVCSFSIGYADLETYLPLVLGMFEISPAGSFGCISMLAVSGMWLSMYVCPMLGCADWTCTRSVCLWGEFSGPHIENVFRHLDREGGHNLSRGRSRKEMKTWAQNDSWLNSFSGGGCICMHGNEYVPG